MNHLQKRLLEQCTNKGFSVQTMYEELKVMRDLSQRMQEHCDEVFNRKVWKKSVMVVTNYGGSRLTSREDVLAQLNRMESSFLYSCTPSEMTMFCNMVFWSLEAGVPSAMKFLDYFRKLLRFALKHKDVVFFQHPLTGFPVALRTPDKEVKEYQFKVNGKKTSVVLYKTLPTTNAAKTATSSVPGIIHSTDAALLALIKAGLEEEDMAYIHDSVGVHPNNLAKAKTSVADALTALMEGDCYQKIASQILEGIPEEDIPEFLKVAPFENTWENVAEDIKQAYYAFS